MKVTVKHSAAAAGGLPAGGRDDDDQEDDGHNHPDDPHHLHVLPPVLPLEARRLSLKLVCPLLKIVGPLVEFGELAVPLQHLLHVDPHDVHHFPDLRLRLRQAGVPLLLSHPELF